MQNRQDTRTTVTRFETKSLQAEGEFEGYAAIFHETDQQQDRILPGAFAASLKQGQKQGISPVRVLWQHDPAQPIGILQEMREDSRGLYVRAQLLMELQKGREAHALLRAGALKGLSIGYRVKDYDYHPATGIRELKSLELFEISLVTFPANELAEVSGVKGYSGVRHEALGMREEESDAYLVPHKIALSDALDGAAYILLR